MRNKAIDRSFTGSVSTGAFSAFRQFYRKISCIRQEAYERGVDGLQNEPRAGLCAHHRKKRHGTAVAAIILAAGKSSRMRNPEHHKLLARLDGEVIIRKTVSAAINSRCTEVQVVTGYRNRDVEAALSDLDVRIVFNPFYERGMASSIIAGVQMLETAAVDGIMILPGDMPAITTAIINRLVHIFRQHGGRSIVRAAHAGRRGNPVIIPSFMKNELLRLQGDVGARAVIEHSLTAVIDVETGKAAHTDIDTPEDMVRPGAVFDCP